MKCGSSCCKLGGEVSKDEAIKVGTRYWHKECLHEKEVKQEIEKYWLENINKGTVIQLLRKAIKDLCFLYEADYIYYLLTSVKGKGINLSYPMGLKKIADDNRFKDEWSKIRIKEIYNKNKTVDFKTSEDVVFVYKKNNKRITDLI